MPTMTYTQSIDHCLADAIGPAGLTDAEFSAMLAGTSCALDRLRAWKRDGGLPLLDLPGARDDLAALAPVAQRYRDGFSDVVILGTGGSSLGGRSLYALVDRGFGPPAGKPRLHFMDNVDPDTFAALFAALDPARTGIIAISKSGGTAETLSQTLLCMDWLRRAGRSFAGHITIVSEDKDNALRRLAAKHNLAALEHDPGVGGRYAVLSLVGMLPALIVGQDAAAVRAGAAEVLDATLSATRPCDSAPAVGAAVSIGLARHRGIAATVLMPYCDRLVFLAKWFRQLWAESLGKDGVGTVPIDASGTVDQHSQLQLYLGGPNDKLFTLIKGPGGGDALDGTLAQDDSLGYLVGRSLGDLLNACQQGTADSLAAKGRPVRVLEVPAVDEKTIGALMMHYMLETSIAAHLLGVNPFDQPEVEDGKQRARAYLEAMGGA
jgi:glucose-6-phosphate isomerase